VKREFLSQQHVAAPAGFWGSTCCGKLQRQQAQQDNPYSAKEGKRESMNSRDLTLLEKRIRQQNVELVDRSAIYLKQCFWVSRSISAHHFELESEFPDSDTNILYQMIYGKPTRNVRGYQYAATRFQVFAISPHGNRFAMQNTVDVKFGDRIPECDRQVHFYAYAKESRGRHGWVHMGRDTSHYLLQSHISHYSTFPQYKSIVQFGYLALPFLQQVNHWLPLSLLFEIICYAAPFLNDGHSVIDYDMSRFTPDLRLPIFLQFQRYLWLNSSETISVDVNETNVAQVNCSNPLLPLLNANSRRKNTKRAFEPIKKCLKNSVKFDASEYTPACWWRLWQWNNSDSLLSLRRISTPSHLKLAFVWQREVYSSGEAALALIRPLLSQCLQASKDLFQFFCNVRAQHADIGQAEDGVWYIFPMEMDLQTVDATIDQFLLDNKWTLQENPKELEAKAKQSASKRGASS